MSKIDYILNPKNIMRMDYIEDYVGIKIPKSILFNTTTLSSNSIIYVLINLITSFSDICVILNRMLLVIFIPT